MPEPGHSLASSGESRPIVVLNPAASGLRDAGRRARLADAVAAAVADRTGSTPQVIEGDLDEVRIALSSGQPSLVAVVGGDGSVREAAAMLGGRSAPLAIVPAGTGNVLASALRIPRRPTAAIELIRTGAPRVIDLGRASWGSLDGSSPGRESGSQIFVVACGLGLDARIMGGATGRLKRRLGFGAYVLATARELGRLREVRFTIETEDETHELAGLVVLAANLGELVPGLIGPRHSIDPADGRLDILAVRASGLLGGLGGSAELLLSDAGRPDRRGRSLRLAARRVRIVADPPQPVQVDGDPHEAEWLAAEVLPAALTVLVP